MKQALLFDHFGPYHLARLRAAGPEVTGIEFFSRSSDYSWETSNDRERNIISLFPKVHQALSKGEFYRRLVSALNELNPQSVVIPGWSSFGALAALKWCLDNRVPKILMSESSFHDEVRCNWKEIIKSRLVLLFDAALVGGSSHSAYLKRLGMCSDFIFTGYDAVDNEHFKNLSLIKSEKERPYFLASARFIGKKNLKNLVLAYAYYRQLIGGIPNKYAWNLVIIGDGDLRPDLEKLVNQLQLNEHVRMPGFKQYRELPFFYNHADVFIHASTTEQWGLVVNEAMSSSLPVLVSERCGCAKDLLFEGVNGYTFDPYSFESLAKLMLKMSLLSPEDLRTMGRRSLEIISHWGPDRFADGLNQATKAAFSKELRHSGLIDGLLIRMLCRR